MVFIKSVTVFPVVEYKARYLITEQKTNVFISFDFCVEPEGFNPSFTDTGWF